MHAGIKELIVFSGWETQNIGSKLSKNFIL